MLIEHHHYGTILYLSACEVRYFGVHGTVSGTYQATRRTELLFLIDCIMQETGRIGQLRTIMPTDALEKAFCAGKCGGSLYAYKCLIRTMEDAVPDLPDALREPSGNTAGDGRAQVWQA